MAQRKQLSWTELRVGVFVLAGLFIMVVGIFYITGGGVWGPKYTLKTYLPEVEGLQVGAPVRLDGVEIGNVASITLAPHPPNREHNILLVLRIDKHYQDQVRTDSTASLITEGLLGNRYVTVSRGLTGTVIPNNGEIPGIEEAAIKEIVERGADVVQNLGTLSTQINDIVTKIQKGQGSLGKLLNDPSLYNNLNETAGKLNAMTSSVQEGQGSIGKLVASDELYNKANKTIGDLQNVVEAVREQKGTMGKLVYDPSLYENTKGFMEKGNALLGDVREGKGTLGKLATDDSLFANLRDASAKVRDATAKLDSNESTAGKFFTDPAFYDNMTGLTGDMRLLISDFRKNPKKFLHVKMAIF